MARKINKKQVNVRLSPAARKAVYKLAREQGRTISGQIEFMVMREVAAFATDKEKEDQPAELISTLPNFTSERQT
jgi:hypothetical protein